MSSLMLFRAISHRAKKFVGERLHHQPDFRFRFSLWGVAFIAAAIDQRGQNYREQKADGRSRNFSHATLESCRITVSWKMRLRLGCSRKQRLGLDSLWSIIRAQRVLYRIFA